MFKRLINYDYSTEKSFFYYMLIERKIGFLTAVLSFVWGAICIFNSFLIGETIDRIFLSVHLGDQGLLLAFQSILVLITSLTIGWFLTTATIYCMGLYGVKTGQNIRSDVFQALQNQSERFFGENTTGELVSKATNDIDIVRQFIAIFTLLTPIALGEFIFCITFLLLIDIPIGLFCILSIPFSILLSRWAKKDYGPIFGQSRKHLGLIQKIITENVENVELSRTFNSKETDLIRFEKENINYLRTSVKAKKIQARIQPIAGFVGGLVWVVVLGFIGGARVIDGVITIGNLISATFLTGWIMVPVRHVTNLMVQGSEAKAAGSRILDILHSAPEIKDNPNAVNLSNKMSGEINFEAVSFGFDRNDQNSLILKNIDFTIPAGSTVALLGGTGSGKTSLINLIPRYYDTTTGTVRIDGIDVRELSLESLRKNIGFVDQESFLFNKSIKENISFGKPNASMDDIIQVAKIAAIHEYIESLPDVYDTKVGERGITLSGGQRQRMSIARCLLTSPRIVIFDDSLSAVDIKTEKEIEAALEIILNNRTVIIVTQRLSATSSADLCILMHNGSVIEYGTHEELMKTHGAYNQLYQSQVDGIMDLSILTDFRLE